MNSIPIQHDPPNVRRRTLFLMLPALLTLPVAFAPIPHSGRYALAVFMLSPVLGQVLWRFFGPRGFTARPVERGGTAQRSDGASEEPPGAHSYNLEDSRVAGFSAVVTPRRRAHSEQPSVRLPCLRRDDDLMLLLHPMMWIHHVITAGASYLLAIGSNYGDILLVPLLPWTFVTFGWLAIGGWCAIELKDGAVWLDDALSREWFKSTGRQRIFSAQRSRNGITVESEWEGELELTFPKGSLPADLQRRIVLDLLAPSHDSGRVGASSELGSRADLDANQPDPRTANVHLPPEPSGRGAMLTIPMSIAAAMTIPAFLNVAREVARLQTVFLAVALAGPALATFVWTAFGRRSFWRRRARLVDYLSQTPRPSIWTVRFRSEEIGIVTPYRLGPSVFFEAPLDALRTSRTGDLRVHVIHGRDGARMLAHPLMVAHLTVALPATLVLFDMSPTQRWSAVPFVVSFVLLVASVLIASASLLASPSPWGILEISSGGAHFWTALGSAGPTAVADVFDVESRDKGLVLTIGRDRGLSTYRRFVELPGGSFSRARQAALVVGAFRKQIATPVSDRPQSDAAELEDGGLRTATSAGERAAEIDPREERRARRKWARSAAMKRMGE